MTTAPASTSPGQDPPQSPEEGLTADFPGFQPRSRPSPRVDPAPPDLARVDGPEGGAGGDANPKSKRPTPGSSPTSSDTPRPDFKPPTAEAREAAISTLAGIVKLASMGVAAVLRRRFAAKDIMATNAEAAAIAEPLVSIAERHAPEEFSETSSDLFDAMGAAIAVGGYAVRASTGMPGGGAEAEAAAQAAADANPEPTSP